jgi:hypothetical protein
MFPEYKMGIAPVDGDRVPSFDEIRAAIEKGRRDSPLIAQALRQAERLGLSGEDKYVMLAYQALIHLDDTHKRLMRVVSLTPGPITFELPKDIPGLVPAPGK